MVKIQILVSNSGLKKFIFVTVYPTKIVCSDVQYHSSITSILPNLQILDGKFACGLTKFVKKHLGGHVNITAAFRAMEEQITKLSADPNSCPTPPSEPWFTQKELYLAGAGDAGDIDCVISNTKSFAVALDTQEKISDMLKEECSHLLRKSSTSLSKASK